MSAELKDFHLLRAQAAELHAQAERLNAEAAYRRGYRDLVVWHRKRAQDQDRFVLVHRSAAMRAGAAVED